MSEFYLWANALIYAGFALWCTLKRKQTSIASGYISLNNSGKSEYLVIYGGLQFGLALFFAYLALNAELHKTGIMFALLLYVPIVIYRIATIYFFRSVKRTTLIIGAMEVLLLVGAIISFITIKS